MNPEETPTPRFRRIHCVDVDLSEVAAGDETDVLLAPWGTYPQYDPKTKKTVQQVVDRIAAEALEAAFSGEVLVDADHSSANGGSTEALAWITRLFATENGVSATFKWTDRGAEAVSGRRYRFVSPEWTVDESGRPDRLVACALTNKPNIPGDPILNSSAGGGSAEPKPNNETSNMDKLKQMLGLAPDADDAAVEAAVQALLDENASLKETAQNAEAEKFAEENEDKCDKETLRNAYLQNPEVARSIVQNMKATAPAPAARKTVCNSAAARAPDIARDRPLSERLRGMSPEQACAALLKD